MQRGEEHMLRKKEIGQEKDKSLEKKFLLLLFYYYTFFLV